MDKKLLKMKSERKKKTQEKISLKCFREGTYLTITRTQRTPTSWDITAGSLKTIDYLSLNSALWLLAPWMTI